MQYYSKFLAFALLLVLASCNKDDSSGPSSDLSGEWKLTDMRCDDGKTSTTVDGQTISGTFTFSGKNYNVTLDLNSDGSFTSSGSYTQVLKTTVLGQTVTQEVPLNGFSSSGDWSQNGNNLVFTGSGETQTWEIVTESDTEITMKTLVNKTETDAASGAVFKNQATIFATIVRN